MRTELVDSVMTREVVTASEDAPFKHLVMLMHEHGVSGIPIVDEEDRLTAIVTEADLLRAAGYERQARATFLEWLIHPARVEEIERSTGELRARDVMPREVISVRPETSVAEAARVLLGSRVKRLPVTDAEGRVVGISSRGDLLRPFLRADEDVRREILRDVVVRAMWLDPATVQVRVRRGVVTLEGTLERRSEKHILLELARRVAGVVGVQDRISYHTDDRGIDSGPARAPLPGTLRLR